MSTVIELSSQKDIDRYLELRPFLDRVWDVKHLLQPDQLAMLLNILDELDALIGDLDPGVLKRCSDSELIARAEAIRSQFEAANEMLYEAARDEITLQGSSPAMKYELDNACGLMHPDNHKRQLTSCERCP